MDYTYAAAVGNHTVLHGVHSFAPQEILDCGQSFRWNPTKDGGFAGIAMGKWLHIRLSGDTLTFFNTPLEEFERIWRSYFDLNRDYKSIKQTLRQDSTLAKAVDFAPGMRVLRQDPWEALCSFILSQNNNIARIRGIVERLCVHFGERVPGGHAFPTPEKLATCSLDDLSVIRSGFRAKYILDAAKRVASGELELEPLFTLPLEQARKQLQTIYGVGPKVAECALLYGFARVECVPEDVWMKRVLSEYYPDGMPEFVLPVAGIAQQYLFHYIRHHYRDSASA